MPRRFGATGRARDLGDRREGRGRETALFAAALAALLAHGPAEAKPPVGSLECRFENRPGFLVTAFRTVNCSYRQAEGVVEYYTGYAGLSGADNRGGVMRIVYDVSPVEPHRYAALEGNYETQTVLAASNPGEQVRALVGGRSGRIVLRPLSSLDAIDPAPLDKLIGLYQLHLIYDGRS